MQIITTTGTERSLVVEQLLEDIAGGGTVVQADFPDAATEMADGALLGVDSNGLYHLVKTAKIVAGGSSSVPRIELEHELKVDDVISDGVVALTIATITSGTTYDTLTFDSGSLSIFAEATVLFEVETEDTTGSGVAALATVQDTAGDYLVCTVPIGYSPADFNGASMTIEQAADDVLAVAYDIGVLTISLADTTPGNNNIAEIQVLVRALGTVEGLDWSGVVFTGTDWDDKQTGATLTTATDLFDTGVNSEPKVPLYTPVAVSMQVVDLTIDNTGCGLLVRGRVRESEMSYYVNAFLKAYLPLIRFV